MRRSFWPNPISQRFRSINRSTGLKFTPIRENSRLSIKIVQNVLFTLCGGSFGQIVFFNFLHPKVALPDWNSRQYVRTVGFLWKLYKTCFSGNGENVLAKSHFLNVSEPKIALPDWISRQYVKTVGFLWKLYKTCFSGHVDDVSVKSHFQRFIANNRSTGLKLTPIRENSRLPMRLLQNVLFTLCGGRFGQNAFVNVLDLTIALLDWNSRQYVRTVGFLWKLYKTCFSGNGENVLGKSHFFNVSETKIALPDWISRQYVKTVGFLWKLYKTCFSRYAEEVLAKSHFSTFRSQKSLYWTEFYANTQKQ